MTWLAVPALAATAYWVLVIVAAWRWRGQRPVAGARDAWQPVSILKPVHGRDPHFWEAIRSHAVQEYPEFEILFGLSDPNDPAADDIRRLMAEFPKLDIRLIASRTKMPNGKVGVLADLAAEARHPLLLINDSDIRVPPDYLRQVTVTRAQPQTGLVTCLYRATSEHWPGRWEALGVATEFVPSVLVARMLGSVEFALGSTMLLRAEELRRMGGFAAIGEYLADDYQLGRHILGLGLRVVFAPVIVETHLGGETWGEVWRHQLRWSRTIRASRAGGYFGYLVTHATFWGLMALAAGAWQAGTAALVTRLLAGMYVAGGVLRDGCAVRRGWLVPFRDLWGFVIWVCGAGGRTVEWRGERIRISRGGKILKDL
ncbi:MAG TPA: bacteriohopanetetrol glucosamine biosynthesis glycosyltransferase HpnI [Bryobacteraceae bacterium]|nr:bacteriohopanetetrol glucosamine biosynthesis glycosyltransferase HpnI [Bryobacteraceae bacterium]